ncbi:hypothetical protein OC835_002702 [Tilletia horrida]|nr:hypothetical protein OC835_002702 [Tilletia horrida]
MFRHTAGITVAAAAASSSSAAGPRMLALAPAAASTAAAAAAAASSQQQQHRSLSSTVLFTRTREEYNAKRVTDLKDELRQRGLATSGKRDELVRRLLNDDVRRAGSNNTLDEPHTTTVRSKSTAASPSSSSPSLASLRAQSKGGSTSTSTSTGKKTNNKDIPPNPTPPPPAEPSAKDDIAATVTDTSKVISAGIAVDKAAVAGDGAAAVVPGVSSPKITQPVDSNPPGVPPEQLAKASSSSPGSQPTAAVLDIKIPYEAEKPRLEAEIPLVTSYFHPGENIPDAVRAADEEYQSNPKVVAVGGSPHTAIAHHATDAAHPPSSSSSSGRGNADDKHSLSSALSSVLSEMRKDLGLPAPAAAAQAAQKAVGQAAESSSTLDEASKAIREAISSVSQSSDSGPSSGSSSSSSSSSSSFSSSSSSPRASSTTRPLNAQERTGAYLLGAIVFGGLLVGGIAAPADPEKKDKKNKNKQHHGAAEVVSAAKSKVAAVASSSPVAALTSKTGEQTFPSPIEASDPVVRARVNKALEDLVRSSSSSSSTGSPSFSTGHNIVGAGERKW